MSEFFANLDRYRAGGKGGGDRGAYLRLYNGGPYSIDRIGRGSFTVPNWSACFLGGMQPGPIQNIAKNATEDGLLQRFLYAVPGPQQHGRRPKAVGSGTKSIPRLVPRPGGLRPPRTQTAPPRPRRASMPTRTSTVRPSIAGPKSWRCCPTRPASCGRPTESGPACSPASP